MCVRICYLKAELWQRHSHRQGALWIGQLKQNRADMSWLTLTSIRIWTWISTYIIFVAQVDAADVHLQVFNHLSGHFLRKRVLLFILGFVWNNKQYKERVLLTWIHTIFTSRWIQMVCFCSFIKRFWALKGRSKKPICNRDPEISNQLELMLPVLWFHTDLHLFTDQIFTTI